MIKNLYITTPIYYASGEPHIGHVLSTVIADTVSKYFKKINCKTFFVTGMDEHGEKIDQIAKENKKKPSVFVNEISEKFISLWKKMHINYSVFVKTDSSEHKKIVRMVIKKLIKKHLVYKGMWEGLYCVKCEENYTLAQARVAENGELFCRVGHKLTKKKEKTFFLNISKFSEFIDEVLKTNVIGLVPQSRINEITNSFLKEGLQDLSISRKNEKWGIKFPHHPQHTIYVWVDALISYLSALGYLTNNGNFNEFWQNKNSLKVHIMSKEITRFHAIYWPIILKALDLELPSKIISHGWLITNKGKMSKSLNNVIDPNELIKKYGSDILRYYLIKETSREFDSQFSENQLVDLFNSDLANIFGNLVSRCIGMIEKYNNGTIQKGSSELNHLCNAIYHESLVLIQDSKKLVEQIQIKQILINCLNFAKSLNKFVEEQKPWQLKDSNEINNFLYCLANGIKILTSIMQPILPEGCSKITKQMRFKQLFLDLKNLSDYSFLDNHKIGKSIPIYSRINK